MEHDGTAYLGLDVHRASITIDRRPHCVVDDGASILGHPLFWCPRLTAR